MKTVSTPRFIHHKDATIEICINCTLPECDDADPRCPLPSEYKRKSRAEKAGARIAETAVSRAVAECRGEV